MQKRISPPTQPSPQLLHAESNFSHSAVNVIQLRNAWEVLMPCQYCSTALN